MRSSFKLSKSSSSDKLNKSKSSICSPTSLSTKKKEVQENDHLVVCFGELLIDFVPTLSGVSLSEAPGFKKAPGGAPANVAVGIARLGGSSAFIGKVGEDDFGHMLADILKQNNVDNSGMRFDTNARTALAFVTLRADGEREFMFFRNPSADMLLTEAELDKDLIHKVSEDEITFLTEGEDAFDDNVVMTKLFHSNLKLLLVTEGGDGCRYYTKDFHGRVNGIKVTAVDTTGAGDAFDEKKLRDALFFANGCGAITVTEKGAIPALPTKEAVLKILDGATTN
ncbi:Fructokinase-2 [Capsicum baccatum]|uniref:Fructokinase-2 n=1 Tax=Capsicum baccatum TaxID=33114 RepID=A0A2G2VSG4_CAPBA|nr:Fructokinase-2 [Capsicum baccatum]